VILELGRVPLSANGKVDRAALHAMAVTAAATPVPAKSEAEEPPTARERQLLAIWRDLLGTGVGGPVEDFFAAGGNSLTAVRLFRRIEAEFGRRLPLASLFRHRTVRAQARLLDEGNLSAAGADSPLVAIGGHGRQQVVMVHPVGGDVLCYGEVAAAFGQRAAATLLGLRARGLRQGERPAASVEEMAADYAAILAAQLPPGPVHLVGWSMGGTVALRMAALLERRGRQVASLMTVDSFTGRPDPAPEEGGRMDAFFADLVGGSAMVPLPWPGSVGDHSSLNDAQDALQAAGLLGQEIDEAELARLYEVHRQHSLILERHAAQPWVPAGAPDSAPCLLIRATRTPPGAYPSLIPLDRARPGFGRVLEVDEDHFSVVRGAGGRLLADHLAAVVLSTALAEQDDEEGMRA
jgi:mycobactin phenyloxazoline synthetase